MYVAATVMPGRTAALAVLAALAVVLVPRGAIAGTIGFRTDAEVSSGPGLDAKVTLTHTGDETAEEVGLRAELLGHVTEGATVPAIGPGQNQVWNFHLLDEAPKGVYTILLRTRYTDANGYPFEVVSTAAAPVGVKPAPRIFGSLEIPRIAVGGEVTARLVAKRPPGRSGSFEARIVAPAGLEVKPDRATLEFDAAGKATAEFRVRNLKLLAGTAVNVFGLVTGTDPGFPQIDTIRGSASIGATVPRVTSPMFYRAAFVVLAILVLLEGIAWAGARRGLNE